MPAHKSQTATAVPGGRELTAAAAGFRSPPAPRSAAGAGGTAPPAQPWSAACSAGARGTCCSGAAPAAPPRAPCTARGRRRAGTISEQAPAQAQVAKRGCCRKHSGGMIHKQRHPPTHTHPPTHPPTHRAREPVARKPMARWMAVACRVRASAILNSGSNSATAALCTTTTGATGRQQGEEAAMGGGQSAGQRQGERRRLGSPWQQRRHPVNCPGSMR